MRAGIRSSSTCQTSHAGPMVSDCFKLPTKDIQQRSKPREIYTSESCVQWNLLCPRAHVDIWLECQLPLPLQNRLARVSLADEDVSLVHRCLLPGCQIPPGTNYIETLRVQVHANCRIRRIYFSDRLYSEEELPQEFKLFLPIQKA